MPGSTTPRWAGAVEEGQKATVRKVDRTSYRDGLCISAKTLKKSRPSLLSGGKTSDTERISRHFAPVWNAGGGGRGNKLLHHLSRDPSHPLYISPPHRPVPHRGTTQKETNKLQPSGNAFLEGYAELRRLKGAEIIERGRTRRTHTEESDTRGSGACEYISRDGISLYISRP